MTAISQNKAAPTALVGVEHRVEQLRGRLPGMPEEAPRGGKQSGQECQVPGM
jgi:hypothetical protein